MRPLNRPMFKYGGPIKEGIMQGMKEPQAINTVGSPLAPKDASGRQGYAIPIIGAGLMAAARFLPAAYRGFKAARAYTPLSQNLGFKGRLLDIIKPKGGLSITGGKAGEGAGFRTGSFLRQNPFTALPIAGMAIEGGGRAGAGLAKMTPDLLRQYANAVIPFADPFTKKEEVPTKKDGTGLKRDDKKSKVIGDTTTGTTLPGQAGGTTVKSDAEKRQINEARIQETKDKYYKLMGIDKMNKDAVYDSLIDASKIVSEEGADLKGAIRSGSLQNRIIQAVSQNLDKSADLKKQIDAAILKGEIEKDIKASDPSNEIVNRLREVQIKKGIKELEGSSVADVLATAEIGGKNLVTSNTVSSILKSKGTDVDFTFPDDKYQKWEKNNENKDEIDYLQENYGNLDDGLYVVNKKAIQVSGGKATFVDLDKITG